MEGEGGNTTERGASGGWGQRSGASDAAFSSSPYDHLLLIDEREAHGKGGQEDAGTTYIDKENGANRLRPCH